MDMSRWITYKAKDGIIDTYLDYEEGLPAFQNFIRKGLKIAVQYVAMECTDKLNEYRFLDTFFSDTINDVLFEEILKEAQQLECNIKVLLSDPFSSYAQIRASSINQCKEAELSKGLKHILDALKRVFSIKPVENIEHMELKNLMNYVQDEGETHNINIRFYSDCPSGPMYFLRNLLLCGRFNAGKTAALLPWTMIVKDPSVKGDIYDIQLDEFEYLWESSTKAR